MTTPTTERLSPRVREALWLALCGMSKVEAARAMRLAPATYENYLRDGRELWETHSTLAALVHAIAIGVFTANDVREADAKRIEREAGQ